MKIMLVDDELPILESLKSALRPTGYECEMFQSSPRALEEYSRSQYDVVVTDFMMPVMNGIELLKAIKEVNPDAYVIILTGYADIENAIAALNHGAYAFFRKPLDFRDFIITLQKIEEHMNGLKQKEIDMDCFLAQYARLKSAFESLQQAVQKLDSVHEEK